MHTSIQALKSLLHTVCWLERQTRDRKVATSNPDRSGGRVFFSRVNFVCRLLFGVRFTPVLPQWHVKDPGHSAKSAGGRLHINTHTSLTQRSRSGLTMPLLSLIHISEPTRQVACKRPRSFCQMCRWQVTPKHTDILDPMKSEWPDYVLSLIHI